MFSTQDVTVTVVHLKKIPTCRAVFQIIFKGRVSTSGFEGSINVSSFPFILSGQVANFFIWNTG